MTAPTEPLHIEDRDVHATAIRRFRDTFQLAGDAVLASEDSRVLTTTGPLAATLFRPAQLLHELNGGAASPPLVGAVDALISGGRAGADASIAMADGAVVSMRLYTIISEDGQRRYLVGVLSAAVVPSELERLRHDASVYDMWFERAPSGVCLVDTNGKFLRTNPSYCRIVGRTEDELISLSFQDITHPDDLLVDVSLLQEVLAGVRDRYDIDKRYVRPDGSIVWVHLTVALLRRDDGAPIHFIAMIDDVSVRQAAEERLELALERLTVANREKAALMTALSHDLRSPMAAIRILADLLTQSLGSSVQNSAGELAQRIQLEAARTEGVLSDILAADRINAGLLDPRREHVEIAALIRRVVAAETMRLTTHEVVTRIDDDDEVLLWADPALVERLVANLIANAIKHTPPASTIWVSLLTQPHRIVIRVEDDGPGVKAKDRDRIFEPFIRGRDDRPGSGVGLHLVRAFAEFHGGSARCTARPGGGARFEVQLPRISSR